MSNAIWQNPWDSDGLTHEQFMFVRAIMSHLFIEFDITPSLRADAPEWRFRERLIAVVKSFDKARTDFSTRMIDLETERMLTAPYPPFAIKKKEGDA